MDLAGRKQRLAGLGLEKPSKCCSRQSRGLDLGFTGRRQRLNGSVPRTTQKLFSANLGVGLENAYEKSDLNTVAWDGAKSGTASC